MLKRSLIAAAAASLTVATASSALAAPAPLPKPGAERATSSKVPASLFGMHDHGLTDSAVAADDRFGGIRIWDNGATWSQVNSAPGVYDWTTLDTVVSNARATGAQDILYVLGYTPDWAASFVKPPCSPGAYTGCSYYPGGTGSPPSNPDYWTDWVRAVATKYKGQITSYQIWNEANLTSFFDTPNGEGSPQAMARLTVAAERVIRQVDPSAKVITASSTVVQKRAFVRNGWFKQYVTELKRLKSKPDGIAVHLYPWVNKGPGNGTLKDRANGLALAQKVVDTAGYKGTPLLDTEMNYGNNRNNGWPKTVFSQGKGAAYLAQTYLESLHNGVVQVDWYGWDDFGLGIWPTSESGRVLQPGIAYRNLLEKLAGSNNKGCTITKSVTNCLTTKQGKRSYWVYRPTAKNVTYTVPASFKVNEACDVLGKCKPIRKGRVKVGLSPLQLTK